MVSSSHHSLHGLCCHFRRRLCLYPWYLYGSNSRNGSGKWKGRCYLLLRKAYQGILCLSQKYSILTRTFARQAVFLLLVWAAGLPVIMNPSNSIAVSLTQVDNANLYFSAWGAFVGIFIICGSLAKEMFGYNMFQMAGSVANSQRGHWYALLGASVIVLGSSIRVLKSFKCNLEVMQSAPTCRETKFAISASVFATLVALGATYGSVRGLIVAFQECMLAGIMMILWCFGLIFVTFGEGPGHSIGNLFFATWACFLLSVLLTAETYRAYVASMYQHESPRVQDSAMGPEDDEEAPMETIPVQDDDL